MLSFDEGNYLPKYGCSLFRLEPTGVVLILVHMNFNCSTRMLLLLAAAVAPVVVAVCCCCYCCYCCIFMWCCLCCYWCCCFHAVYFCWCCFCCCCCWCCYNAALTVLPSFTVVIHENDLKRKLLQFSQICKSWAHKELIFDKSQGYVHNGYSKVVCAWTMLECIFSDTRCIRSLKIIFLTFLARCICFLWR